MIAGLGERAGRERPGLGAVVVIDDRHRGLELALVSQQGGDLGVELTPGDRFDVVGLLALEQQQRARAMVGEPLSHVFAVVVRIAGGDDGIDGQETRSAMIGVHAPTAPRVVPEDDVIAAPGLREACRIFFGDDADAKFDEYLATHRPDATADRLAG